MSLCPKIATFNNTSDILNASLPNFLISGFQAWMDNPNQKKGIKRLYKCIPSWNIIHYLVDISTTACDTSGSFNLITNK